MESSRNSSRTPAVRGTKSYASWPVTAGLEARAGSRQASANAVRVMTTSAARGSRLDPEGVKVGVAQVEPQPDHLSAQLVDPTVPLPGDFGRDLVAAHRPRQVSRPAGEHFATARVDHRGAQLAPGGVDQQMPPLEADRPRLDES